MRKNKSLIFNKLNRFNRGQTDSQFFCEQNLLKNQISIEELEINKEQELAEKFSDASQEAVKYKSKKKKITSTLLFALNFLVVAAVVIYQFAYTEVEPIGNILGIIKWPYLFLILGMFFFNMWLDAFRTSVLLKEATGKFRVALSYKTVAIGKYWDCATPMATGGQPFQVLYLNKHGVDTSTSISVPLGRYVLFQVAWLLLIVSSTIFAAKCYPQTNLVSIMSYVGCALNALLLFGTWFLSVSKKTGKILVAKTLKLLSKMKIIKNYDKVYDKVMDTVSGFQSTMAMYTKKVFTFIGLVLSFLVQLIIMYSSLYIIYLMFGGAPSWANWLQITIFGILIDLAAGIVPLPGGSGMSELSFAIVFAGIFPQGTILWATLIWRFVCFYSYLLQGIIVMIYDSLWGNKKLKWQKKKWELEQESKNFKEKNSKQYKKRTSGKIKI